MDGIGTTSRRFLDEARKPNVPHQREQRTCALIVAHWRSSPHPRANARKQTLSFVAQKQIDRVVETSITCVDQFAQKIV
jgi:hypothetical protein